MSKREYMSWVEFMAKVDGKHDVEVVKPARAALADVVVCRLAPSGEKLLMPDNLLGHCPKCFRMIQFRPDVPKLVPRICDECMRPEIAKRAQTEEVTFYITENTARDLEDFKRRKKLS